MVSQQGSHVKLQRLITGEPKPSRCQRTLSSIWCPASCRPPGQPGSFPSRICARTSTPEEATRSGSPQGMQAAGRGGLPNGDMSVSTQLGKSTSVTEFHRPFIHAGRAVRSPPADLCSLRFFTKHPSVSRPSA